MSTRARRSTGNLNPATIHFLPISRLKEELQARGIDSSGSKEELAYRLEEHLQSFGGAYKHFDPSPIVDEQNDSNKRGRGKKRKFAIDHENDAERENIEESHQLIKQKPMKFTWATEKPTAEHIPVIKPSTENEQQQTVEPEQPLNSELKIAENNESTPVPVVEEKTPKKKVHEQKNKKGETTTLEEITKVLVGTSENKSDLGQSSIIDEENKKELKEEKRKRKEEKRLRREEKEKRQKELEDAIKVKKSIAPIPHIGGNKPKEDATKLKNPKNVVANLPNKSGEQRQEHKIFKVKEKVGTLEKRRITLAGGEERKLKQSGINAGPSISTPTTVAKAKPPQPQQIKNTTISRLDILDSIFDEQEQLLARKKAQKAAEGGGADEGIDFELELRRREKGRFPGFSTIQTTPQTSQQQQKKMHSNLGSAKVKSTISSAHPMDSSGLKLSPPPPPPKKAPSNLPENQQQFSPSQSSSSIFSLPLIVDTRDPLGLSSVGPDTPPPPPPPPSAARPTKMPPMHSSFPISLILPPPPPPPPRKALVVQQQKSAQNRQEEAQKPSQQNNNESIVNVVTEVISDLTANVSKILLNDDSASEICQNTETETDGSHYINAHSREILANEYQESEKDNSLEKHAENGPMELEMDIEDEESTISGEEDDGEFEDEEDDEDEEEISAEGRSAENDDNNDQETPAELRHLLKDPKALLHKASDVLRKKFGAESSELEPHAHYEQVALSMEEMQDEEEEEYRQLPDPDQFHGEPIPDDMDDDLFEIAAGLPLRDKKRDKEPQPIEEEPLPNEEQIELDFYNSDLNMKSATNNKWLIEPDNADGFALMWGGVRSNYGLIVPEQRDDMPPVAFQVKISELLSLKHLPFEEPDAHDIRIGWSRAGTSLMLGESPNSFAFNSMANKATGNIFTDYGEPFGLDDVITTVLDINCGEIRYFKNGQSLGPAFTDIQFQTGDVYFPHIATKNCKLFVNFGIESPEIVVQSKTKPSAVSSNEEASSKNDEQWSMPMDEIPEGTKWIGAMNVRQMSPSKRPISDKAHCTIIAMIGLSGVGKTTWVRQYLKEHPEENWFLLNTDTILQAMAVNGVPRQRVHQGRWDMVMGLTAKALSRSLQMACRRRHNYILDQTNVTREARKKKLTQFQDFQRKCVVIIPSEAEHERRLIRQAREQGGMGQMPAEAMLEMKGNFSIPSTELEPIEDVIFIEPPIERINEAIEQVRRYNEEGQPWVRQQQQRHGRNRGPPAPVISDHSNLPFVGTTRICV